MRRKPGAGLVTHGLADGPSAGSDDRASLALGSPSSHGTGAAITATWLPNGENAEMCPGLCEDLGGYWNRGAYVTELGFEHGEVRTAYDAFEQPYWETEADVEALVGCGCTAF